MRWKSVWLEDTPRRLRAVFPLRAAGFIDDHGHAVAAVKGKLELCLRLGSTAAVARDRLDDETYATPFPNVIFKLPAMTHRFTVDRPRDAFFLQYPPRLADAMVAAGLFARPLCRPLAMTPALTGLLAAIRALFPHSQEDGVADRLDLLAMRVFAECLLPAAADPDIDDAGVEARLKRVASYFQLHFAEPLDLDAVARANGLSRRTLFRRWREAFGGTPADYVQSLKLREARRLLAETSLPVRRVAERLGFADANYFSAFFKRRTGQTPLRHRARPRPAPGGAFPRAAREKPPG